MKRIERLPVKEPNPDGTPRVQRFYGESLAKVKTLAPWAKRFAKVDNVRIAYESEAEYFEKHGLSDLSDIRGIGSIGDPFGKPTRVRKPAKLRKITKSSIESIVKYVDHMEAIGRNQGSGADVRY